jgi:hypothetical protein
VQQERCVSHFFEGRAKCRDEFFRQVADKSDRIGENHRLAWLEVGFAKSWVERRKRLIGNQNVGTGERIE